jgi:hypothetical protein
MYLPAMRALIVIQQIDDTLRLGIAYDWSLSRLDQRESFFPGTVLIDAVRRCQGLHHGEKGCKPYADGRP